MQNTVKSLGEMLAAQIQAAQEKSVAALQRKAEAQGEEAMAKLRAVVTFFSEAQAGITADILARAPVRKIVLGQGQHKELCSILQTYYWNDSAAVIDKPSHPYHLVWAEFAAWAVKQGLKVGWRYEWDGGGIESWHILTVEPLGLVGKRSGQ